MKILAVDNVRQRLDELERTVMAIFPYATIKSFIDPMMAAKYGVQHNVDVIIAKRKMRHIDGFQMADVVHKFNTDINIYLIKEADEAFVEIDDSHVAGWLERPHIAEQLREMATKLQG